jgi:endonuclease G
MSNQPASKMTKRIIILLILLIILAVLLYFLLPKKKEVARLLPENPGLPAGAANGQIVDHFYYTLSYNEAHEQANWVMYRLPASFLTGERAERSDNFRTDPEITTGSATPDDYKRSGYDRGHLLPAADMGWSVEAMSLTFLMSNMSPQEPSFNRGIWKKLETRVREWAVEDGLIYVVTGPVLEDGLPEIGEDQVSVPKYFYKVILDYQEPEIKGIGFVMANRKSNLDIYHYAVSIDSVEKLTGLDFFPALPDGFEAEIEFTLNLNDWFTENISD